MEKLIRFVTPQFSGIPAVYDLYDDGTTDGQCTIGGVMGNLATDYLINPIKRMGYNCTIKGYGDWGSFDANTRNFSGVIGSIQYKTSDAILISYPCPTYDTSYGIECSSSVMTNLILMSSTYNFTNENEPLDIIDLYSSLDSSYWVSIGATFIFFILVWSAFRRLVSKLSRKVRKVFKKSRKSSIWFISSAFLDQDNFPTSSFEYFKTFNILSILISTFIFIMIHSYVLEVVGSDLVVVKKPQIISSYEDAVNRNDVTAIFFKGMFEAELFKNAKDDAIRQNLYENANIVEPSDYMDLLQDSWPDMVSQRSVTMFRDYFTMTIVRFTRSQVENDANLREMMKVLLYKDVRTFEESLVYSASAPSDWKRLVNIASFQMRESGISTFVNKNMLPRALVGTDMPLDEFASFKPHLGSMPEPVLSFNNLYKLLYIILTFVTFSTVSLIWEKFLNVLEK